jgi:hypothetical protein
MMETDFGSIIRLWPGRKTTLLDYTSLALKLHCLLALNENVCSHSFGIERQCSNNALGWYLEKTYLVTGYSG